MIAAIFTTCCLLFTLNFNFNPSSFFEDILNKFFYLWPHKIERVNLPASVKPKDSYTIVLAGDSMTHFLGDGGDLKRFLSSFYPQVKFNILNYGYGGTNILSMPDRLRIETKRGEEVLAPILKQDFDVFILESFGNNPLSHLKLKEGLKKQTETLDEVVKLIHTDKPEAVIIFLTTIAPSRQRYGEGVVALDDEQKKAWVEERVAYMKNHIKYARDRKIPLINIYRNSLKDGDGNIDYLSGSDFIHPSSTGLLFISSEIADYLFKNRVFTR